MKETHTTIITMRNGDVISVSILDAKDSLDNEVKAIHKLVHKGDVASIHTRTEYKQ